MMSFRLAGRLLFLISVFMITLSTIEAGAEERAGQMVAALRKSAKLHNADSILADFERGKATTAVIVLLKPPAAAQALAEQSRITAQAPAEFQAAGAPAFYNLRDESVKAPLRKLVGEHVGRVLNELEPSGVKVTQKFSYQFGFAAQVTPEAMDRLLNHAEVLLLEKDEILKPHLAQGIPLMNATTPRSTYNGTGISIAICDTGIDTMNPQLGGSAFPNGKVIGGYDTGDNDTDPTPGPGGYSHGTSCAGIAAGYATVMGDYIGGVAPAAKLYSLKISGADGTAAGSSMIAAWEWAVTHQNDDPDNPIMIISTSFGGGGYTSNCDSETTAMTTAAANAVAAGITIFASSGNDGYCDSIAWPACISYVNSVGAVYDANIGTYYPCVAAGSCVSKAYALECPSGYYATDSTFANKVTSYSNTASFLTLLAPGTRTYTLDIAGAGGSSSDDFNTGFGGTSAACPYAAGAVAVLQQAAKSRTGSFLTPTQVRDYLISNGDSITDSKVAITKPRVNLGKAVDALSTGFCISGTVRSGSLTGPLLAGATVSIAGQSVVTGADGSFSICGISTGAYTLSISKLGYGTYTNSSYSVSASQSGLNFFLTSTSAANLTPYQPTNWSGKIVVTRTAGSLVSSTPLYATDTLYIDWAVLNNGTSATGTSYSSVLYVDGVARNTWTTAALQANAYTFVTGYSIGTLAAGNHTIKIVADSANAIAESNEADNEYSTTITVLGGGYSIIGTVRSGSATGPVLSGATVSIAGKTATTGTSGTFSISGIAAGTYTLTISKSGYGTYTNSAYYVGGNKSGLNFYLTTGYSISGTVRSGSATGPVLSGATVSIAGKTATTGTSGTFTIRGLAAGTYTLAISKSGYGTYTNSVYYVGGNKSGLNFYLSVAAANLTPYQPNGWSGKIVVTKTAGSLVDSSPLYATDPLYVDWAVINSGTSATSAGFSSTLYIDGVARMSWSKAALPSNYYAYATGYAIGKLSAGTHTISIFTDSANAVAERSESDNRYTRTIRVY